MRQVRSTTFQNYETLHSITNWNPIFSKDLHVTMSRISSRSPSEISVMETLSYFVKQINLSTVFYTNTKQNI